jgi:hypothetical protein
MRYKITTDEAPSYIRNRQPFQVKSGSLSGAKMAGRVYHADSYYLIARERAILADVNDADYAVYSYWTPIAWHDGAGWHVFDRSFTATTNARHLPVVRQAIGAQWHYDWESRELVQTRPAMYVAESVNANVTPYQAELLRGLQAYGTLCYSGIPTVESRREIRSARRLVEKGYAVDASTPATPDVFKISDLGRRAYV